MSAFVVSNKHITAILLAYNRARIASHNEIGLLHPAKEDCQIP